MKWEQVKEHWLSVSQQVKRKWGKFSDEDLAKISGQRDTFVSLLEQRYEDDHAEAERKVDAFVQNLKAPSDQAKLLSWPRRFWQSIRSYGHAKSSA